MTNKNIFLLIIGVLVLGTIATILLQSPSVPAGPGKYDTFATCLKDKGANFYGAFWCPHCQAQKKLFGSSVKFLPYIECSTPDASSQTQICTDKKIESYPTWVFPNPIKVTEKDQPIVCTKAPGIAGENSVCDRSRSAYAKVWIFSKFQISSELEPVVKGDSWTFDSSSQLRGEIPLEELANQTSCVLPQ